MSDHDDFLVPQDADLSIKCSGLEIIILSKQILVIFAGLSVLCCLYLLWMYFVRRTPILRRHPTGERFCIVMIVFPPLHHVNVCLFSTELAVFKCIFDLIFFQQFLWTPSLKKQVFYSDDLEQPEYYCTSSEIAAFLAFLTQFSHLGGALCFLVISIDLRIAYTNPFASIRHNWPKYAAFVVAVSSVSALALIAMGPRVYGISSTGSVWIQNRRSAESVSYPKVVLYYWFLLFIYTYSMWANFQFFRFRERGLVRTVSNRINIMNRSRLFVVAYITYDLLVLALQFVSFVTDETSRYLYSFDAYGDALRGTYNLIVILYISWSDVTWENMSPFQLTKVASGADALVANVAMESLLLQPHLNTALRAEILFFATQGIIYAAREGAASEAKKSVDRSGSQSRSVAPNSSEIGSLVGSKGSSARQSAVSGAADDFGVIDSDSSRIIGRATMAALPSGVVSEAGAAAAPVERHTFTTDISSIQESKSGLADGYRRNKMRGVRPSHNKIFSFTARQSA